MSLVSHLKRQLVGADGESAVVEAGLCISNKETVVCVAELHETCVSHLRDTGFIGTFYSPAIKKMTGNVHHVELTDSQK